MISGLVKVKKISLLLRMFKFLFTIYRPGSRISFIYGTHIWNIPRDCSIIRFLKLPLSLRFFYWGRRFDFGLKQQRKQTFYSWLGRNGWIVRCFFLFFGCFFDLFFDDFQLPKATPEFIKKILNSIYFCDFSWYLFFRQFLSHFDSPNLKMLVLLK